MTKPLSVLKYYRNNQRKIIVVFLVTFLSAFLQSVLLVFSTTMINFYQATTLEPVSRLVIINSSKQSPESRDRLRRSLDQNQAISKVLPIAVEAISLYGIDCAYILFLQSKDIESVMDDLNLTLINGQLPTPGTSDVVLHWKIAANKGLKIGDHFGSNISQSELLVGEYRLVGLFDGQTVIGLSELDCTKQQIAEDHLANLIIPQKGQIAQVKNYLAYLVQQDNKLNTTIAQEVSYYNVNNSIIMLFNIIYLVITSIVTICVSFLFYIYFYQRRPEFGLLEALGHTRQTIIGKAFLEISGVNLLGFIGGLVVAAVCEWALSSLILLERGLPLVLWDQSYTFKLLSTPLFVTFSSLLPVWRMLKKVDPISIIEGEV